MKYDVLVVGAGFAGSVCARELAERNYRVLLIDKRHHVGGNAYDSYDSHGVLIHPYGPHIFHTNSERIFNYLSRFTEWRHYEHRVLAQVDGGLYPIPINRNTLNQLYNLGLQSEEDAAAFYERVREPRDPIRTSEDLVLSTVGRDLCERFFSGYTRKQWGLDLKDLSAGVAARVPARASDDDRYFTDPFQYMPARGYTAMFNNMLEHPAIDILLSCSLEELGAKPNWKHIIYTGPIDAFFNYRFGKLGYRSLLFEHQHFPDTECLQAVGTVNYPNDYAYTRITEFRHITGQAHTGTSIVREYPVAAGEPYYPIPNNENESLYKLYKRLADETPNVSFIGRLAQYRYYNMDQVVGAALSMCKDFAVSS